LPTEVLSTWDTFDFCLLSKYTRRLVLSILTQIIDILVRSARVCSRCWTV
jgi:hypothetical protein